MVWLIVDRVVQLITLVMLIVMLSIIFVNGKKSQDYTEFEDKLNEYKIQNQNTRANNIAYIENRHNKLQEQQDTYQILVDRRLLNMEAKIKLLDATKVSQRVINTNINNNAVGSSNMASSQ